MDAAAERPEPRRDVQKFLMDRTEVTMLSTLSLCAKLLRGTSRLDQSKAIGRPGNSGPL